MLERERQELLAALQRKLAELTGTSAKADLAQERCCDPLDEAQAELGLTLAVSRMSLDWDTKQMVETAMDKLRNGDYGICEACGEPINSKRLEAVPWATLCVACQSVAESNRNGHEDSPAVFEDE
jgi:DnaK suppressor protein